MQKLKSSEPLNFISSFIDYNLVLPFQGNKNKRINTQKKTQREEGRGGGGGGGCGRASHFMVDSVRLDRQVEQFI